MDCTIMQPKHQEMDRNQGLDSTDISSRGWSFQEEPEGLLEPEEEPKDLLEPGN
jgi:hypothetical protein